MNPNLQFRVDRRYHDVSGVMDRLFKPADSGFVFEHPPTPKKDWHIHGYMFNPTIVVKTLRGKVKTLLSTRNNDYETSNTCGEDHRPIDMSGAFAYGSKFDTIAVSWTKNISPDLLEQLRSYARTLGETIGTASNPPPAVKQVDKSAKKSESVITHYQLCLDVLDEAYKTPFVYENKLVESEFGSQTMAMQMVCVNPAAVYNILLKHLKKHRIMTEVNQLTRFMTTILREDLNQGERIKETVFLRLFSKH